MRAIGKTNHVKERSGNMPTDEVIWKAVVGIVSAMAGVIATLWKIGESKNAKQISSLEERCERIESRYDKQQEAIDECNHDRGMLHGKIAVLESELSKLRPGS
ncbi:MAG: hypothetical protein NXI32_30020 [bacterium]|nr:hypothetical protein [bacterium]